MSEYNTSNVYTTQPSGLRTYLTKVFGNMAIALGITTVIAAIGYMSFMNGGLFYQVLASAPWVSWLFLIAEFGVVIAMGNGITKWSTGTIRVLMFVYAAITGVTFSILPLAYGIGNTFEAFLFAAALFVGCAIIGKYTKYDLTKFSGLFMGALFALVIMSLISLFVPFLRNGLLMGYLGLALFLALTAWDVQRISQFYYQMGEGTIKNNLAIYGAFELYLDFINVFLYVLQILGRSSRNSNN